MCFPRALLSRWSSLEPRVGYVGSLEGSDWMLIFGNSPILVRIVTSPWILACRPDRLCPFILAALAWCFGFSDNEGIGWHGEEGENQMIHLLKFNRESPWKVTFPMGNACVSTIILQGRTVKLWGDNSFVKPWNVMGWLRKFEKFGMEWWQHLERFLEISLWEVWRVLLNPTGETVLGEEKSVKPHESFCPP